MDLRLYRAVISDDQNIFSNYSNVLLQVTSQRQDTILHIAAKFKRKDVSKRIMDRLPSLVYKRNSKGDTPLHIAARLGSLDMVELLIDYENDESVEVEVEANERLMRMVNNAKNTALHEAVRKGHFEVVKLLIRSDQELVKFRNEAGESPLFIAVDNMHLKIADHILKAAPICSFDGRNGMNALHAAVMRMFIEDEDLDLHSTRLQNPLFDIFHFSIKDLRRFFGFCSRTWKKDTHQGSQKCINIKDFIKQLMEKCPSAISEADNFGWTPLHLATYWDDLCLVKDLLSADNSVAYIKNNEGMTALHIAAREGRVHLLREIEETCPDIWDFEDKCGRTALHIAVERGNIEAVKFILKKVSEDHINQQDNEGNTALHLAALQGNGKIFALLTNDGRADKTTLNNKGTAVMDKVHSNMELTSYGKVWMIVILSFAGGLVSLDRVLNRKHSEANPQGTRKEELEKGTALHEAERLAVKRAESYFSLLRNVGSTNILVATLIATISFAAAFTVPGGFNSDGTEAGKPILLRRSTSFRAFIVANTVAFCCSTASISLHNFNSMLTDTRALQRRTYIAIALTNWAVCAMHTAFVTGSYAVLTESLALAIVVLIIGCFFLAVQLYIFFHSVS